MHQEQSTKSELHAFRNAVYPLFGHRTPRRLLCYLSKQEDVPALGVWLRVTLRKFIPDSPPLSLYLGVVKVIEKKNFVNLKNGGGNLASIAFNYIW